MRWPSLICLLAAAASSIIIDACDNDPDPVAPASRASLSGLTPSSHAAPADGATQLSLAATLNSMVAGARREVAFTTTLGTLLPSGTGSEIRLADSVGRALVVLQAPRTEGLAIVQAVAGETILEDTVRFIRAYPERVLVEPSKFAVSPREDITITAYLKRLSGVVTAGTPVDFAVSAPGRALPGRLGAPSVSNADGAVTVRYTPTDSTGAGPVIITATVQLPNNETVSGQTTLDVVNAP